VAKLIALLGDYFTRMSDLVMHHDGIIDKYIGDCIMAVWGAPFPIDQPEVRATACGVMLWHETEVDPLRGAFEAVGEKLAVRVGVSSGEVLAGNMGSSERMSYTVIGDPVNLAARLESLNKQYGTRVMVSDFVADQLRGLFALRLLGVVSVVGKDQPVAVWEVLGACASSRSKSTATRSLFSPDSIRDVFAASVDARVEADQPEADKMPHVPEISAIVSVVEVGRSAGCRSSRYTLFAPEAQNDSVLPYSPTPTNDQRLNAFDPRMSTSFAPSGGEVYEPLVRRGSMVQRAVPALLSELRAAMTVSDETRTFGKEYTEAVRKFVKGRFADALQHLATLEHPSHISRKAFDNLTAQCREYAAAPPSNWTGVTVSHEK